MSEDTEYQGKWISAKVECDICGHEHISVHPSICERIECPNCGYMLLAPSIEGLTTE